MAVRLEDYIPIEEGVVDYLYGLWSKAVEPHLSDLITAAERNDLDRLGQILYSIDVQSIAQEAEPALRNHVYASYTFGALHYLKDEALPQPAPAEFNAVVEAVVESYKSAIPRMRDRMLEQLPFFVVQKASQEPVEHDHECSGYHHTPLGVLLLKAAPMSAADKLNAVVLGQAKVAVEMEANVNTSRLVSLGYLYEAMHKKEVQYQISAVLDDRTCPVCQVMHGKVFYVESAYKGVLGLLQMTDPEQKKAAAPFPSSSKAGVAKLLQMSTSEMWENGIGITPFHPLCRCREVPVGTVDPAQIIPVMEKLTGQTDKDFVSAMIATPEQLAYNMGLPLTPEFEAARVNWGDLLNDNEVKALEAIFNNAGIDVWMKLCAGIPLVGQMTPAMCAAWDPNKANRLVADADGAIMAFELDKDTTLYRYAYGDVAQDIYGSAHNIDGSVIHDKGWVVASEVKGIPQDPVAHVKVVIKVKAGTPMIKVGKSYAFPSDTSFQVYAHKYTPTDETSMLTLYTKVVDAAQTTGLMPPPLIMPKWAQAKMGVESWEWYKSKGYSDEFIWDQLQELTHQTYPVYKPRPWPGLGATEEQLMAALPPDPKIMKDKVVVPPWIQANSGGLSPEQYKQMIVEGSTKKFIWGVQEDMYAKFYDNYQIKPFPEVVLNMPLWAKEVIPPDVWSYYKGLDYSDGNIWVGFQNALKKADPKYEILPWPGAGTHTTMLDIPAKAFEIPAWLSNESQALQNTYLSLKAKGWDEQTLWKQVENLKASAHVGYLMEPMYPGKLKIAVPYWATYNDTTIVDYKWYYSKGYSEQYIWDKLEETKQVWVHGYKAQPYVAKDVGPAVWSTHPLSLKTNGAPQWVYTGELADYISTEAYLRYVKEGYTPASIWNIAGDLYNTETGLRAPEWPGFKAFASAIPPRSVPSLAEIQALTDDQLLKELGVQPIAQVPQDQLPPWAQAFQGKYTELVNQGLTKEQIWNKLYHDELKVFVGEYMKSEIYPGNVPMGIPYWAAQDPVMTEAYRYYHQMWKDAPIGGNTGTLLTDKDLFDRVMKFKHTIDPSFVIPEYPGPHLAGLHPLSLTENGYPVWVEQSVNSDVALSYKGLKLKGWSEEEIWFEFHGKDQPFPGYTFSYVDIPPQFKDMIAPNWANTEGGIGWSKYKIMKSWGTVTDEQLWALNENLLWESSKGPYQIKPWHAGVSEVSANNLLEYPLPSAMAELGVTPTEWALLKKQGMSDFGAWEQIQANLKGKFPNYVVKPYPGVSMLAEYPPDMPKWAIEGGLSGQGWINLKKDGLTEAKIWDYVESEIKAFDKPGYLPKPWPGPGGALSDQVLPSWAKDAGMTQESWLHNARKGITPEKQWDILKSWGKVTGEYPGVAPEWFSWPYTQRQWEAFKKLNYSDQMIWDAVERNKMVTAKGAYKIKPYPGPNALHTPNTTEPQPIKIKLKGFGATEPTVVEAGTLTKEQLRKVLGDDFVEYKDLTYVDVKPGGSIPGDTRLNQATGEKWVIKEVATEDIARNEVLTSKLYQAMGIDVPDLRLVNGPDGKVWVASKWLDGFEKVPDLLLSTERLPGLYDNFAADAWLSNWDVVGAEYDNIGRLNGKAFRIDVGGGLRYRAQGEIKTAAQFTDHVQDLENMRNPGLSPKVSKVFADIKQSEMLEGIRKVTAIPDSEIRRLVRQYGPIDPVTNSELADRMIARKNWLVEQFGQKDLPPSALNMTVPKPSNERVTDLEYELVKEARLNGYSFRSDVDQIEGQNALVHMEKKLDGSPVTQLTLKVRGDKAQELTDFIKGHLAEDIGVGPNTLTFRQLNDLKSRLDEETVTWAKGFFTQAEGGNPIRDKERLRFASLSKTWSDFNKKASAYRKSLSGLDVTEAKVIDAELKSVQSHYRSYIAGVNKAMDYASKEGTIATWDDKWGNRMFQSKPMISSTFENLDLAMSPTPVKPKGLTFEKVDNLDYNIKEWQRGFAQETGSTYHVSGQRFVAKDAGMEIEFVPASGSTASRVEGRSRENQLIIRINGDSKKDVEKLFDELEKLGINGGRATELDQKFLYYKELAYLDRKDWEKFGTDLDFTALPIEDQVDRMETYFTKKFNFTPEEAANLAYGKDQIFMQGLHYRERPDLQGPDWDAFARDYKLIHDQSSGEDFSELLDKMLNNGTRWANTNERMRMGIPLTGTGLSTAEDVRSGGADYFFFRINNNEYALSGGGSTARVVMNVNPLRRTDTISYPGDKYGQVNTTSFIHDVRKTTIEGFKEVAGHGGQTNETIVKGGTSLFDPDVQYILLSPNEIAKAKKVMAKHGFETWIDGRPLDEVLVTSSRAKELFEASGGPKLSEYLGTVPDWAQKDEILYKTMKLKGDSDLAIQQHMEAKGYKGVTVKDEFPGYTSVYQQLKQEHPEWTSHDLENTLKLVVADPSIYPDWLKTDAASRATYAGAKIKGMTDEEIYLKWSGSIVK